MRFRPLLAAIVSICFATASPGADSAPVYAPTSLHPPIPYREFRGVWVATVANIDWPSKPGLPVERQKAELLSLLDRAARLNLNAVIFQVRPACDAMYDSKIEPWSPYLTGVMGEPPKPYYDPLAFAITEAHQRGLELHAWMNPYRAAHPAAKSAFSANHISRTHPELVRRYGEYLWLDPGEPEVQDHALSVVMDVVRRYDIDGLHFDDYFYPYRVQDSHKRDIPFPDDESWRRYGAGRGLSRDDWRRENVNRFVRRAYQAIKLAKPWVKFGVSPFGIWQPGYPAQIRGANMYEQIYCDSRKWLAQGWVDYLAPQLYWAIQPPDQSYPVLLKWWEAQNACHRLLWPGLNSGNAGGKWKAQEILDQIQLTRKQPGASGEIQFSMKCLLEDRGGLATALSRGVYAHPALVPATPWLDNAPLSAPKLTIDRNGKALWEPEGPGSVAWWVFQTRTAGSWETRILPGHVWKQLLTGTPDMIGVTAVDRCGVASPPTVVEKKVLEGL